MDQHYPIPGWLAENLLTESTTGLFPGKLQPSLGREAIALQTILLAQLQQQLLQGEDPSDVHISSEQAVHYLASDQSLTGGLQAMEHLVGLRVLLAEARQKGLRAMSLFPTSCWHCSDHTRVDMKLGELSLELLLGIYDPYSDFVRFIESPHSLLSCVAGHPPLLVSRSAWLDFKGVERHILLQLEKAGQWDNQWLSLDGVLGFDLSAILNDLKPPLRRSRSSREASSFTAQMRTLKRLGRKLAEHGILSNRVSGDYLAFGQDAGAGTKVIWQLAGGHRIAEAHYTYYQQAAAKVFSSKFIAGFPRFLQYLSSGSDCEKLTRLFLGLSRGYQIGEVDLCLKVTKAAPLYAMGFFFELAARLEERCKIPLPEHLREHPITGPVKSMTADTIVSSFQAFKEVLHDSFELRKELETEAFFSVVSEASRNHPCIVETFHHMKPVNRPKELTREVKRQIEDSPNRAPRRPDQHGRVNLHKIASDELMRIRKHDQGNYEKLKANYYATLDEGKRRIILELQSKLDPSRFEDHLRHSLIKYMVANPRDWQSAPSSSEATH